MEGVSTQPVRWCGYAAERMDKKTLTQGNLLQEFDAEEMGLLLIKFERCMHTVMPCRMS